MTTLPRTWRFDGYPPSREMSPHEARTGRPWLGQDCAAGEHELCDHGRVCECGCHRD